MKTLDDLGDVRGRRVLVRSDLIVGTLARILPSSVIRPSSSGTLRSERTSTRLPRRSPSVSSPLTLRGSRRRR